MASYFISPFQLVTTETHGSPAPPRTFTTVRADMGDYLPPYYRDSTTADNLLSAESAEIANTHADIADVLAQFFVDTATWGLANWERMCGVTVDDTKPIEQRRSVIRAKLRGIGTVNVALIKKVAESFANGSVSVTEDNANYKITITFDATLGVPQNPGDIQAALREIVPAHIDIVYEFIDRLDGTVYAGILVTEVDSVTLTTASRPKTWSELSGTWNDTPDGTRWIDLI